MSIVRDDCDEREMRVDRMIDEFRRAQSQRLAEVTAVQGEDQVVELQRDANGQVAVAGSTPTPTSH